ncbi:MAG: hypothetical protein JEY99_20585 [Spirochaetales bacterium]|nr:hypothetical protein [Spirochaetales bacterium]
MNESNLKPEKITGYKPSSITFLIILIILLTILNTINIRRIILNNNLIDRYATILQEEKPSSDTLYFLSIEKERLTNVLSTCQDKFFQRDIISYYDFVDLLISEGEKHNIKIEEYETERNSTPPSVSVTAAGSIEALLSYLYALKSNQRNIPLSRFTLNLTNEKTSYRMIFTAGYLSTDMFF